MIYTISILAVALIVLATVTYKLICRVQELDTRVRNGSDLQTERLQGVVDQVNDKFDELDAQLEVHVEKHNRFVDYTKEGLEEVGELKGTVKSEIPRLEAIQRTAENTERGVYAILNNRDVDNVKEVKQ